MRSVYFQVAVLCLAVTSWGPGAAQTKITSNTFGELKARNIGPAIMSGRVTTIDALQADPRLVYIGTASGGLWKSTNGGVIVKPVFDKHTQSIGAVCIDQDHPDTVWVGTGESWTRNSVSIGTGIYKSTDGGERWKHMGLESTERIARIIIHPDNPDIVFVAALGHLWGPNEQRGVFKTKDGGQTWNKVLYIDENTGCSDIDIDPDNPDIVYAGMWQFRRRAWDFYSGGPGSGLYKSVDGGENWEQLTQDLPDGEKGRIAVRVSPASPNIVYTLIEAEKTALYRSNDSGASWGEQNSSVMMGERPFYFSLIVPDPVDTNRIYKPGWTTLSVSTDGGEKFRTAFHAGGSVHADHHSLWISHNDPDYMYLGTDGGAYVSNDKGSSWRHFRNMPVSQFYRVSVDMQKPYHVYGGLQDNGSWSAPSRAPGGIRNYHWQEYGMGDGFSVYADKEDKDIIYWQLQGGVFARDNKTTKTRKFIFPYEDECYGKLRFNWDAAIAFSPLDNTLYIGAQFVFKSVNRGDTWERISPDLTSNDPEKQKQDESGGLTIDNSTAENHCTITCIAESALDKQLIWAGTDDGNLQITRDGGENWLNVSGNIPVLPPNTWCSSVYPSRFDKGTAYATFDGHRNDDITPYIYRTTDFGNTWVSLADDNIKAHCYKVLEDLVNPDLLFVGSEFGLFISVDGGQSWAQFKGNLPNVSVMDMVIHPREHDLVLGTHGRGVYIIDDIIPLRQLTGEVLESDLVFLDQRSSVPMIVPGPAWPGLDDEYYGRNPSSAVPITFYMKKRHVFGKMSIEIFDTDDKPIAEFSPVSTKGINKVYWSPYMRLPRIPKTDVMMPTMIRVFMTMPEYPPGEYKVKIIKGEEVYESTVEVHKNPDLDFPKEEMELRREKMMEGYRLLEDLAYLDRRINDVRGEIPDIPDRIQVSGSLSKKLDALSASLEDVRNRMLVLKPGDLRGEQQLREKVAAVYGSIAYYPGKPTDAQLQRLELLNHEVRAMEAEVDGLLTEHLEDINAALEKAGQEKVKITTRGDFDAEVEN
jgi:photosystem II stability/assembly factor-like uncharacterized protein